MKTDQQSAMPGAWPELGKFHKLLDDRDAVHSLWESVHARAVWGLTEGADRTALLQALDTARRAVEKLTDLDDIARRLLVARLRELGHPVELHGNDDEAGAAGHEVG
jgi:hypothetical protein